MSNSRVKLEVRLTFFYLCSLKKRELIRCDWCDGCRTWFGPQTTNEGTSTLADEYIDWIMIFWLSSVDQNSPRGEPFQVWQMQLPLPEKWEMIRCAWCDDCRTQFCPQTTNESTSTLADEYIGWIMIFWPSSVDQNLTPGDPFQVWQMQLPLPEKWGLIRCAWCNGCRMWFSPQMTNESISTLADEYIGWIMIFDHPQWTRTHLRATLSRFDKFSSHFLLQRSDWIGCNLPLCMTPGSNGIVMETVRWSHAKQGVILALWSHQVSTFSSKIQVQDLVPCPTIEKVRVKKLEKRKVRVWQFSEI